MKANKEQAILLKKLGYPQGTIRGTFNYDMDAGSEDFIQACLPPLDEVVEWLDTNGYYIETDVKYGDNKGIIEPIGFVVSVHCLHEWNNWVYHYVKGVHTRKECTALGVSLALDLLRTHKVSK